MSELSLRTYVWAKGLLSSMAGNDEAGEGVISTAIAVLIMAALGAVMWVGYQAIWDNAAEQTTNQINQIGAP